MYFREASRRKILLYYLYALFKETQEATGIHKINTHGQEG